MADQTVDPAPHDPRPVEPTGAGGRTGRNPSRPPGRRALLGAAVCAGALLPAATAGAVPTAGAAPTGGAAMTGGAAPAAPRGSGEGAGGRLSTGQRRRRARRAVRALQLNFSLPAPSPMLSELCPRREEDPDFSYCWPLSQARSAACELSYASASEPAQDRRFRRALEDAQQAYWYAAGGETGLPGCTAACDREQGPHGDMYYDDNAWVGLQDVEEHLIAGGRRGNLERARAILELLRSGEDTDPDAPSPGGIFWTQAGDESGRNTVSTVPSAKLALRLHQITGDATMLRDAQRWVSWARGTLLADEGLFWDNIAPDGTIDRTFWSYNQGVPLGTEALLFEITGRRVHRDRAVDLADAVVRRYAPFEDGGGLDEQPLQFAAILTANLVMAQAVIGDRIPGRAIAQAYADRLWSRRDPGTDLYDGEKREGGDRLHLLDQAGYARALAVAAIGEKRARLLC
ncbi:glycoside hydrolase family 76 protein [Brachybacterium halotolerans subsp. kimchii]|uniref:glycoside hydrolase family 76 protein n=1 Tax=Brachybacterium halotolerans TaxID=2795215 RepID=UPI001E466097|nr:glycoside hydrolase family 76 protein [Brachybacterium halotolerans]UEJ82025.1 glycoside hydrolase family 76 protein [Brachybacterium halotolerans subsp. kimchii]